MSSLDDYARNKLAALKAGELHRTLIPTQRIETPWVVRGGRRLLSFSCNDYLNLTSHPKVIEAAAEAVRAYGTGAGASRLVTGDHPLLAELEGRLARLKGTEAACVFSSGYAANTGAIPAFAGEDDRLLIDESAHACIWAGAKLSGARTIAFAHNDLEDLEKHLACSHGAGQTMVLTEGVFSMDGDLTPLERISALAARYGAWLMTDDAHGVGVFAEGRGTAALFPEARIDLQMGTLSKALASAGGYVCGSADAIALLRNRARTFVYSTGLPPASTAAAIAALDIIEADPDLTERPLAKARRFTRAANLPEAQSPIVPLVLGEPAAVLNAQAMLEADGFLVVAIRPPTVPAGTARLRLAFCAAHSDDDIDRLAASVRKLAA
jgi:8-amino-7-oxononanoate synthase